MGATITLGGQAPAVGFQTLRRRWLAERRAAVENWLEGFARDLTYHMQSEAPWSNRTGEARSGLWCRLEFTSRGGGFYVHLKFGYTVGYGFWLETKRYDAGEERASKKFRGRTVTFRPLTLGPSEWGRDAIILPTIEWAEPVLADAIRELYADPTMRTPRLGVSAEASIVPIKRPGRRGPRIYAKPPYVARKPRRV